MAIARSVLLGSLLLCAAASCGRRSDSPPPQDPKGPAAHTSTAASPKDEAERKAIAFNLRFIGGGLLNYAGTYGDSFPASAIYSKDGKPLLSWRVILLAFLQDDEDPHSGGRGVWSELKHDEPWDSPHNKKLVEKMPRVYAPPESKKAPPGHTFYRVFVGPGAAFDSVMGKAGAGSFPRGLKSADFTDGLSQTLLVVEAGEAVPWTKPDELTYDPKKPVPKLGGVFPQGFHALMGDGSVKFIRKEISESDLRALITRNGGEKIDWKKIPWEDPGK
jgi:hypothetical protein